ncbi:MAG: MarR family transcriptional regulator [Oscillospiraceae bacterium]|nr:MarR family transcriptional regulator [Oscillospiraceae bacterium]
MSDEYEALKLENQLCFPLYAAARAMTRAYYPYLSKLNLTYTQYIAMMVLWEREQCSIKDLSEKLYLDTGTITPLLKSMEQKGFVRRRRSEKDERSVTVSLTDAGWALRDKALSVPAKLSECIIFQREDAEQLYTLLYRLLNEMTSKLEDCQ